MKTIQILSYLIFALIISQQSRAQNNSSEIAILSTYYGVKNALITGNPDTTAVKAEEFRKAVDLIPTAHLSTSQKEGLLSDVQQIVVSKNIDRQREIFAKLSEILYTIVIAGKLNRGTVYRDYCPMKKSYWLNDSPAIRNPYFGNQMLTCGQVKETLSASK